jgi:hypothetical protein
MKKDTFLLYVAAVCTASTAIDYAAEGKLWWSHVQFLADDKLAGRDTGSEGIDRPSLMFQASSNGSASRR